MKHRKLSHVVGHVLMGILTIWLLVICIAAGTAWFGATGVFVLVVTLVGAVIGFSLS